MLGAAPSSGELTRRAHRDRARRGKLGRGLRTGKIRPLGAPALVQDDVGASRRCGAGSPCSARTWPIQRNFALPRERRTISPVSRAAGKGPSSSLPVRAPALPPQVKRDGTAIGVALRLAIGKDGLGIELAERVSLQPLDIVELVVRLPNVRFPFDVTGGIAKFRHRRGELERLAVELDARRAARWAEAQLRGLLSVGPCTVSIAPRAFGATVTIVASPPSIGETDVLDPLSGKKREAVALAFEIAIAGGPSAELAIAVHTARGANLPAPATLLAIRAVATLLGSDHVERRGSRFVIPRAAERLARVLLPDAGVRAPNGLDVKLVGSGENDGVLFALFTRGAAVPDLPQTVTLAHETASLTREADDARMAGDFDRARHLDLAAFERAPRHPQIARRIAEVDAQIGGRAEAAIAILRGGGGASGTAPYLGTLLGDLLVEAGDTASAIAALLREGERDPSPAVAALTYARAATLAADPTDALTWLDAAIARAPTLVELRWERAARRLMQGRLLDARADFQELEAIAAGARERYDVLRRAAAIHRARGLGQDAALLYERALLYRPDDPETIAGLGAAIAAEGRAPRGATLLARAIELAGARIPPLPTAWMELVLARILGDALGDRPAAIAHLRSVAEDAPEAIEARALEGRYRAALHDAAGASLAFARLRERALTTASASAVAWLDEAARFEGERGELMLAQSHLAAARAIAPSNVEIEARYRELSHRVGRAAGLTALPLPKALPWAPAVRPPMPRPAPLPGGPLPSDVKIEVRPDRERLTLPAPTEGDERARSRETLQAPPSNMAATTPEEDEARVEALTRTLQGDPTNDSVVDELIVRLTRLGRSMELLALLSARLEDAPADRREELLPRHRDVLERLETEARAAGRDGEADLFRMAREAAI